MWWELVLRMNNWHMNVYLCILGIPRAWIRMTIASWNQFAVKLSRWISYTIWDWFVHAIQILNEWSLRSRNGVDYIMWRPISVLSKISFYILWLLPFIKPCHQFHRPPSITANVDRTFTPNRQSHYVVSLFSQYHAVCFNPIEVGTIWNSSTWLRLAWNSECEINIFHSLTVWRTCFINTKQIYYISVAFSYNMSHTRS